VPSSSRDKDPSASEKNLTFLELKMKVILSSQSQPLQDKHYYPFAERMCVFLALLVLWIQEHGRRMDRNIRLGTHCNNIVTYILILASAQLLKEMFLFSCVLNCANMIVPKCGSPTAQALV
jgi:hypothetical protein